MEDNIQDLGKIIICMVMEFILGKMGGSMRGTMKWIKSMAMVCISGQMGGGMKEIGIMESSTAKESMHFQTVL